MKSRAKRFRLMLFASFMQVLMLATLFIGVRALAAVDEYCIPAGAATQSDLACK